MPAAQLPNARLPSLRARTCPRRDASAPLRRPVRGVRGPEAVGPRRPLEPTPPTGRSTPSHPTGPPRPPASGRPDPPEHMPRTLYANILADLWRLLLLSATALVAVIAFAAAVKPLADGKLDPAGAVKFMLFAVPPMLAYALPFASGFAATLCYHRLSIDNELIAARASGIGNRSLLVPALITGIVVSGALAGLNEQVIPRFLRQMEEMITLDFAEAMIRNLQQGEAAQVGQLEVYADAVQRLRGEERPGQRVYLLSGLAALELDPDGSIKSEVTASLAYLWILPAAQAGLEDPDATAIAFHIEKGRGVVDGNLFSLERKPVEPMLIPSAFSDDPKFLTFGELASLMDRPERMSFIEQRRIRLVQALATAAAGRQIHERVRSGEPLVFRVLSEHRPAGDARATATVAIHAGSATPTDNGLILGPPAGAQRIVVEVYHGDALADRYEAAEVFLSAASPMPGRGGEAPLRMAFRPELEGVRIVRLGGVEAPTGFLTEEPRRTLADVALVPDPMDHYAGQTSSALLAEAEGSENPQIAPVAADLGKQIARLGREVVSKQHERFALAVSCLIMTLTGAVTAMRLRDSPPLVVYLWSFFPALGTVIMISSGQSVTHRSGAAVGLPVLWCGVAGLAVYTLAAYARVARR